MSGRAEYPVPWCHKAGEHAEHHRYLFSLPVWRGAWVIGVNITQPTGREVRAEMTRHAGPRPRSHDAAGVRRSKNDQ